MGRKNSGTLEKRIKDDQTSQGARRSPQASDEWSAGPGQSQTGSGRRNRARADVTDETTSTRATRMQPRVRSTDDDASASRSSARRRATGGPSSSSGRHPSSRYSLPGQSGVVYHDPDDQLTSAPLLATPPPGSSGGYPAESSSRRRTTLGPASSASTNEQPAVSAEGDGTPRPSRRRITSARPVRAEDRALVAATTNMLQAIEVVQDDAMEASNNLPVVAEDMSLAPLEFPETAVIPVTVVPGTLAPTPAWLTHRPRHRRRSFVSGALTCIIALGLILGVLETVSPIAAASSSLQPFGLLNNQIGADANGQAPTGPWDTSAGAADTLGLGGGAAPGTSAPGSAGLPTNGKSSGSGSNKTGPATTISAVPLHPWPPSNQFKVYPPGYGSFGVKEPANDYYYWAFGQCTWWAQIQRGDENLRHMGNAQYWAGSAKARGYRVGSTPAVNATVVFQPGTQGAGGAGHVAHVVKVYPGGWFLISEMNFYWNGGGWGRVDYRYAHSGGGVSFIY